MTDCENLHFPRCGREWNELWREKQKTRSMSHDAAYWNERAKTYTSKDSPDSYTHRFLKLASLEPADVVFDMGCGPGNLTIPLAEAGHEVWAADFSSGMLEKLHDAVCERGLEKRVHILELSWDDDWKRAGIEDGQFDVCFASRSIATDDLWDSLGKLNGACRRRACITLPCGTSPRTDDRMLRAIGLPVHPSFDDCYAIAMLSDMGQFPRLDYIPTTRNDVFESREEAEDHCRRMAEAFIRDNALRVDDADINRRIKEWLSSMLVPDAHHAGHLTYATPRTSHWAFIGWDRR